MNIQCGTDIIEVSRIKENIEKHGDTFLNRIYTSREIEYCDSKNDVRYQHYAARFAAKEAIFKSISTLLDNKYELGWLDMEILNKEDGKPYVVVNKEKLNIDNDKEIKIDISLSHIKDYAIANCIAYFE